MDSRYQGLNSYEIGSKITIEFEQEYPNPPDSLPPEDVERLNLRHCVTTDKFWRMFSGSSSDILSYENGIVEIEITTSSKVIRAEGKPKWTLHNQIKSWGQERLLSKASGYVAHIMLREKALGFAFSQSELKDLGLQQIIDEIKEPDPDIKVLQWQGLFDELPGGAR